MRRIRHIYESMVELAEANEPVDLITLTAKLQDKKQLEDIGSVSYLAELANSVPTAANIDYYAEIVEEKSLLRRLIRTANANCQQRLCERRRSQHAC